MIRQTSIDVYHRIKAEGLLSRINTEIYACIFQHGPLTIKETCILLPHHPETTISPRFADLERRGVISTDSKRPCKITGNIAHNWDVTSRMPLKLKKNRRETCVHCDGKGYTIEAEQLGMFDEEVEQ